MSKISFKVSARTARLIGRENISSSKGAIIELVKNSYDADSKVCIVYFDNLFSEIPIEITSHNYNNFIKSGLSNEILHRFYINTNNIWKLIDNIDVSARILLRGELNKLNTLYIIDAGEGMTQNIIRDYWMTIGTDNKSFDVFTKTGRVKAGAKGIGRFALDKLGSKCEMITVFNPLNHELDTDERGNKTNNYGYLWNVNWTDFEGAFKTIDKVKAELYPYIDGNLKDKISKINDKFKNLVSTYNFDFGTILKITGLRDEWNDNFVNQIFSDLEVLVPPKENSEFKIFLFSSLNEDKYGEVVGSICDDFDYKISATAGTDKIVNITIERNEYDLETIEPDFFDRPATQVFPYRKSDFIKQRWETVRTFSQLLPGFEQIDQANVFDDIGEFRFTLYFMKKTYDILDAEKFHFRKFMSYQRKDWLDKFGGIKLYRDNFRVRPYGEVKDSSFDWLGLGARKAAHPDIFVL